MNKQYTYTAMERDREWWARSRVSERDGKMEDINAQKRKGKSGDDDKTFCLMALSSATQHTYNNNNNNNSMHGIADCIISSVYTLCTEC